MNNFKAYGYNIAVKRDPKKETSDGGIILPEECRDVVNTGVILSVGEGMTDPSSGKKVGVELKVGARIAYRNKTGYLIKVGGEEILILRPDDILGEIE